MQPQQSRQDVRAVDLEPATAENLKRFFEPHVVAVVGANRERNKIGSEILHNLLITNFTGTSVPVKCVVKRL